MEFILGLITTAVLMIVFYKIGFYIITVVMGEKPTILLEKIMSVVIGLVASILSALVLFIIFAMSMFIVELIN